MSTLPKTFLDFQEQYSDIWQAYSQLGETAAENGSLDKKERELIKLGMAAALRAKSAVQSHTHRALEAGAEPEEIEHALLIGITTLGFPTMMTALSWAKEAIQNHAS